MDIKGKARGGRDAVAVPEGEGGEEERVFEGVLEADNGGAEGAKTDFTGERKRAGEGETEIVGADSAAD
jgi:hypothetical protein